MKNVKKIVSILCIICIMVSMLAVPAFAASSDKDLSKSDQKAIADAKKAWETAKANGDKAGMDAAHAAAEAVRGKNGYSGGSNGSTYTPKPSGSGGGTDYGKTGTIQAGTSDSKLSQSDQKKINDAKQEWNAADQAYQKAKAAGDTAGMKKAEDAKKAANAKANGVRSDANAPLYVLGGGRNGESTTMTKDEIAERILTNTAATAAQGNNYQQNAAFASQNEKLRETLASVGDDVTYKNGDTTVTLKNGNMLLVTGKDKDGNVIGTINSTDGTKSTNITYKINDQYSQENSGKAQGGFIPSTVIETNLVTGEKTERVDLVLVGSGSKGSAINYSDAIAQAIEYCEKNGMPANAYNIAGYINKHLMGSAYSVKLDENGEQTSGGKIYGPDGKPIEVDIKGAASREDILSIINRIIGADNAENIMRENGADMTDDFWDTYNKIKEVEQSKEMQELKDLYMALENKTDMTDEEKAALRAEYNARAEEIRAKNGYTAGTDGSFWIPVEKTAGTVYMGNSRIPQPDPGPEPPENDDPTRKTFEIKVTWEGNGTVTPGTKKWPEGSDPSFGFIPGEDSEVIKVIVDGKEVDVKDGYDFKDIKEEHTIHVIFKSSDTYKVTVTYSDGGTATQAGTEPVKYATAAPATDRGGWEWPKSDKLTTDDAKASTASDAKSQDKIEQAAQRTDATPWKTTDDYKPTGSQPSSNVRENGNAVGSVSGTSTRSEKNAKASTSLSREDQDKIAKARQDFAVAKSNYERANASGNLVAMAKAKAEMDAAHTSAEKIRNNYAYTGAQRGSSRTTSSGISDIDKKKSDYNGNTGKGWDTSGNGTTKPIDLPENASAQNGNGTVMRYKAGSDVTITITPADGYKVSSVTVDGANKGALTGYSFEKINADHTVHVEFEKIEGPKPDQGEDPESKIKYYPITVTYSDGGTVKDGRGEIVKNGGGGYILEHMNAKFTFAPDDGFTVVKILIDGKEINAAKNRDGYTFIDITEEHTLHVEFDDKPILDLDTDGVKGDQVIKIDADTFQTKAGYGIEAGTVKVTSQNVTNIKVTATYDFGNGKQTVILEKVGNKWVFPKDTSSTTKARKIYVPIDTPDGDYTITYSVTAKDKGGNTVTPEAAAGANSYTIRIKGNMHEDDFTGDRR